MTGPEHYQEAEALLRQITDAGNLPTEVVTATSAAAQVHATLALAAATALQPSGYTVRHADWRAWAAACKTPPDAEERSR